MSAAESGAGAPGPGGQVTGATPLLARRTARPLDPTGRAFDLSRYSSLGPALADLTLAHRRNAFLVEMDRERVVTRLDVRELRGEVARVATALAARGVRVDDRVAILMSNGPRWLIGATAALGLGAVLVPLDARADAAEQARLLAHSKARVLLADGPVWRTLRDAARPASLEHVIVSEPLGELARAERWESARDAASPGEWTPVARDREAPATIVYSSGTTGGRTRACVLPHRAYLTQLEALATLYPLAEDDVYLSVLPTNHALDFMCGFLVPIACGARVVHLRALRPEWIARACKEQGVTHLSAVPALLTALERRLREGLDEQSDLVRRGLDGLGQLNAWLTRRRPSHALSSALLLPLHRALGGRLRRIFAGGAFVPRATARWLHDQGFPVAIGYGLTEACAVVTVNDLAPFRDDTVGLPLPGTEVRIDAGEARDGSGEVLVRGPQLFTGYLDDPELTAESFAPGGWLRTGDVGRLDAAGHLQLVGRCKHMIVTAGGKNVYPEEVEARFDGLPVEEHAVVAAHAVWPSRPGEDEALVLVVRPRAGQDALAEADRRNRALPEHQRVQGVVTVDASFPRTTSLKLRRDALARDLAARCARDAVRRLS